MKWDRFTRYTHLRQEDARIVHSWKYEKHDVKMT
jgi:hypothetical protein